MRDRAHILYTLGQIARACWPMGDAPQAVHDLAPTKPLTGLRTIRYTHGPLPDNAVALIDRLPADLADPPGPIRPDLQSPYWLGWYHYAQELRAASELGADDLRRAGEALYGSRWQSALAHDVLDVDPRRVREWVARERPIPAGVWADVLNALRERQVRIEDVLAGLTSPAT